MITVASGYREALRQVAAEVGTREAQRSLIAAMAGAKGLTGNKTEKAILRFFYGG